MFNFFKKRRTRADSLPNDCQTQMPKHVAFIMDGNRRWARRRGRPAFYGHQKGAEVIDGVVRRLFDRGVSTVSFYAFSIENWQRPKDEVDFLMKYVMQEMPRHIKSAKKEGARIRFIGRRNVLPKRMVQMFERAERDTAENTAGTIVFAIDYGGRDEIIRAANAAIESGAPVTEETLEGFMDTGDLVPIDLVVRTSGEQRISNFMLWKLAYAEFSFITEDWPDMNEKIVDRILDDFAGRQRRFGK